MSNELLNIPPICFASNEVRVQFEVEHHHLIHFHPIMLFLLDIEVAISIYFL